jgi:Spy/CpxP family protein refolding chaperone
MIINSRTLWTTLVAVLVAAVSFMTLAAQTGEPPKKPETGPSRGASVGRGPASRMYKSLSLTNEQGKQIRALLEEQRQSDTAQTKKVGELQRQLHTAIFADTPDRAKINQLKADIGQAEAAGLAARIELDLKIAQVLTAEQRTKARELSPDRGGRAAGKDSKR